MPALRPRRRPPSTASSTGRAPTRTSQRTTRPPSRPSRRTSRSRRDLSTCGEGRSASPTRSSWRGPTTCVTARSCVASRRSSTTARPASGPTRWGSGECLTSASTRWATPSPTTSPSPTATSDRPTKTGLTPSSPWSTAAASRSARTSSRRWPRRLDLQTTRRSTPPASTRRRGCATSRPRWKPGSASTQASCADSGLRYQTTGIRLRGKNPSLLSAALLVALFAALLAGIVTGLTGFGLALISAPILLFVYEPRTVIVLTMIFSIVINSAVVWDSWQEARKRLALALLIPALFGIVAGAWVLGVINPDYVRLGVGLIVVFSALLLVRDIRLPGAGTRWGTLVAGSASGALSTSTGLAGPPIVLLLASRDLPKHEFRGTSALYFLPMSVAGIIDLTFRGLVDASEVPLGLLLIPAAIAGKAAGTKLLERVSEKTFRAITLGLVILTGTLGITTAALALW